MRVPCGCSLLRLQWTQHTLLVPSRLLSARDLQSCHSMCRRRLPRRRACWGISALCMRLYLRGPTSSRLSLGISRGAARQTIRRASRASQARSRPRAWSCCARGAVCVLVCLLLCDVRFACVVRVGDMIGWARAALCAYVRCGLLSVWLGVCVRVLSCVALACMYL